MSNGASKQKIPRQGGLKVKNKKYIDYSSLRDNKSTDDKCQ